MTPAQLLQPILTDGIRSVNFFNGRLLSSEDLTKEQQANRTGRKLLGQALGDGVAWGLGVNKAVGSGNNPVLTVQPGLAVNRHGETVRLPVAVEITLQRPVADDGSASVNTPFAACSQTSTGVYALGNGVYLLTIAPAWGREGRAPVSGLSNGAADCNTKYRVEGVQFHLRTLGFTSAELSAELSVSNKLRNLAAYKCFGGADWFFATHPLAPPPARYGLLDDQRPAPLTDCEVPLAVLHWDASAIRFIDLWSVRRRLTDPADAARWQAVAGGHQLLDTSAVTRWKAVAGDRRWREAEAIFLQFQDHLEALRQVGGAGNVAADTYFDYLPPAGYLPTGAGNFDWRRFLGPMAPLNVKVLDPGLLRGIIARSFWEDPFPVRPFANAATLGAQPPRPVDVFEAQGGAGFVVFARARHGRIRVFLNPTGAAPQAGNIYAQHPLETNQYKARTGGRPFVIDDVPPGNYELHVAVSGYQSQNLANVPVVGSRTTDWPVTLIASTGPGALRVTVRDATGGVIPSAIVQATNQATNATTVAAVNASGQAFFSNLPAGDYRVTVAGATLTSPNSVRVPVGETASLIITVTRGNVPGAPDRAVTFEGITRPIGLSGMSGEFVMLYAEGARAFRLSAMLSGESLGSSVAAHAQRTSDSNRTTTAARNRVSAHVMSGYERRGQSSSYYSQPTGPAEVRRRPWETMTRIDLQNLPAVADWLAAWQDYLATTWNNPSLRSAAPMLRVNAAYSPKDKPEDHQAYAVFGQRDVPVSIIPADQMTRRLYDIWRVTIPGFTDEDKQALWENDVRYLDELAALPSQDVAEITGRPPDYVRGLVTRADQLVNEINEQRLYYDAMDARTRGVLNELGLTDDVALANANPQALAARLAARLGDAPGAALNSQLQAVSLIEQARGVVAPEAWSLAWLGFNTGQLATLAGAGVNTKDDFIKRTATNEARTEIATLLGSTPQAITDLQTTAIAQLTADSLAHAGGHSLFALPGVNAQIAERLHAANLGSPQQLAAASADEIAAATGLSAATAGQLKTAAEQQRGDALAVDKLASLSAGAARALEGANIKTVGDLLKSDPATVANRVFGGDLARANALLEGLQRGVGLRR